MNCEGAWPFAQCGSCAPSYGVALLLVLHLYRSAVAFVAPQQGTLLVSVAHCLLVRTNALWRIAKAGTEKPVEVRNIGKASPQCDVANTDIARVLCGKRHESLLQPQLGDVCREGCPRAIQHPMQIAR